jgi:hypothetical protein
VGRLADRYDLPIVMTTPVPHTPSDEVGTGGEGQPRIGALRGASVQFDPRRLVPIALTVLLATLAVLAVVFTVAGVHSNNQIDRLHHDGVPVTVTVTGCLGQLGGSGSNAAGYSCNGRYTLSGHVYTEPLPGSALHPPGSKIAAVAVPDDPALVSPVSVEGNQQSSAGVFVLPAVLGGLFVVLLAVLMLRRRRHLGQAESG